MPRKRIHFYSDIRTIRHPLLARWRGHGIFALCNFISSLLSRYLPPRLSTPLFWKFVKQRTPKRLKGRKKKLKKGGRTESRDQGKRDTGRSDPTQNRKIWEIKPSSIYLHDQLNKKWIINNVIKRVKLDKKWLNMYNSCQFTCNWSSKTLFFHVIILMKGIKLGLWVCVSKNFLEE